MPYEGSKDEEELKAVAVVNQNNKNSNVVSDFESESDDKAEENVFDEHIDDKVEATSKTTINAKVIRSMKKLQALYNDDVNKILE